MTIDDLVKAGNFARIMRDCFALLETRYADAPGMAYKQAVDLRAYLQNVYDTQTTLATTIFAEEPQTMTFAPVSIAAMAAVAHGMMADGKTVDEIKAIAAWMFRLKASKIEQNITGYDDVLRRIDALSPNAQVKEAMHKIVDGWARRNGIKRKSP